MKQKSKGIELEEIDKAYLDDFLEQLSVIELENVKIELNNK